MSEARDAYAYALPIPTRWIDCDAYGHVNNAVYYAMMDQVVLDCGDAPVAAGDVAVLIGPGPDEPDADDWAGACDTINYEIVTRMGSSRVPRVYQGGGAMGERSEATP